LELVVIEDPGIRLIGEGVVPTLGAHLPAECGRVVDLVPPKDHALAAQLLDALAEPRDGLLARLILGLHLRLQILLGRDVGDPGAIFGSCEMIEIASTDGGRFAAYLANA
ncbi:MAG: hypothetical protein HC774_03900, partial [Sphingomonadales bacterium]|nr:hypothetical protein [Sphingomonadales bacterium]